MKVRGPHHCAIYLISYRPALDDIDYPDEEDNDMYESQVFARAPKKLQRDFSTASVLSVAEEDPEAAELADLIKDYSKPGMKAPRF